MLLRIYQKEIILVVLFAILHSVIFHTPYAAWLAFFSLVPLLWCLESCVSEKEAVIFGYLAGVLSSALTYYWILHVTVTGFIVICLILGIYPAFFSYMVYKSVQVLAASGTLRIRHGWIKILNIAALWVLVQFLRSNVPVIRFPWALLGYSQWKNIAFIQSADHFGVSALYVATIS